MFLLQTCFVHMYLLNFDQQTTILRPDEIVMESRLELSQYTIENWDLVYFDEGLFELHNFAPNNSYSRGPKQRLEDADQV